MTATAQTTKKSPRLEDNGGSSPPARHRLKRGKKGEMKMDEIQKARIEAAMEKALAEEAFYRDGRDSARESGLEELARGRETLRFSKRAEYVGMLKVLNALGYGVDRETVEGVLRCKVSENPGTILI